MKIWEVDGNTPDGTYILSLFTNLKAAEDFVAVQKGIRNEIAVRREDCKKCPLYVGTSVRAEGFDATGLCDRFEYAELDKGFVDCRNNLIDSTVYDSFDIREIECAVVVEE